MTEPSITITSTTQNQPAPYAYTQVFGLSVQGHSLTVSFEMKYLDRDELSADEIYDEGFTEQDDYTWTGQLGGTWVDEYLKVIERTTYRKSPAKDQPLVIGINQNNHSEPAQYPSEYEMWEYFTQELAQAVFEASGRELPLKIRFKTISKSGETEYAVEGYFAQRTAKVRRLDGEIELPWHKLKSIIKTVFMPDYLPELAVDREPKKRGTFISMEDGVWYKVGYAVLEPSKKSSTLIRLEELIAELSGL